LKLECHIFEKSMLVEHISSSWDPGATFGYDLVPWKWECRREITRTREVWQPMNKPYGFGTQTAVQRFRQGPLGREMISLVMLYMGCVWTSK
jgi:hypothetical protein